MTISRKSVLAAMVAMLTASSAFASASSSASISQLQFNVESLLPAGSSASVTEPWFKVKNESAYLVSPETLSYPNDDFFMAPTQIGAFLPDGSGGISSWDGQALRVEAVASGSRWASYHTYARQADIRFGLYQVGNPIELELSPHSTLSILATVTVQANVGGLVCENASEANQLQRCQAEFAEAKAGMALSDTYQAPVDDSASRWHSIASQDELTVSGSVTPSYGPNFVIDEVTHTAVIPFLGTSPDVNDTKSKTMSLTFVNSTDQVLRADLQLFISASASGMGVVPEAATWQTMLLGFVAVVGLVQARRRHTT
jgi:hypothetical protein